MKGIHYYRQAGTSPYKAYYTGQTLRGFDTYNAFNAVGLKPDCLIGVGFPSAEGGLVDEVCVWIHSNVGGAKMRVGIYEASHWELYPLNLVDQVELDISVGTDLGTAVTGPVHVPMDADSFYIVVVNCNLLNLFAKGARVDFPYWAGAGNAPDPNGRNAAISKNGFSYAAMPDPFPTGAISGGFPGNMPLVGLHFESVGVLGLGAGQGGAGVGPAGG